MCDKNITSCSFSGNRQRGCEGGCAPFREIRRTGFAGPRRIFAEVSLPSGSKNSFFADLPPGVARARKTVRWVLSARKTGQWPVFSEERAGRPWVVFTEQRAGRPWVYLIRQAAPDTAWAFRPVLRSDCATGAICGTLRTPRGEGMTRGKSVQGVVLAGEEFPRQ